MYRVIQQFDPDQTPVYAIGTENLIATGMTYDIAMKIVDLLNHQLEPKTPTPPTLDQQAAQDVVNRKLDWLYCPCHFCRHYEQREKS